MDMDRIRGTAQQVGGKLRDVAGQVTGDRGLRAEGIVDEVAGGVRNLYGQAKDGLRDAADTAADHVGRTSGGGRRSLGRTARAIEHRVEDHPLMGLMVAGTVGYLVGVLLHMRR